MAPVPVAAARTSAAPSAVRGAPSGMPRRMDGVINDPMFLGKVHYLSVSKETHTGGIWIDILILSWSTSEVVSIGFIWIASLCSRLYFISSSIRVPRRRATPTFHPNWKHSITPSQVKCLFFESDFRSFSMCFHLVCLGLPWSCRLHEFQLHLTHEIRCGGPTGSLMPKRNYFDEDGDASNGCEATKMKLPLVVGSRVIGECRVLPFEHHRLSYQYVIYLFWYSGSWLNGNKNTWIGWYLADLLNGWYLAVLNQPSTKQTHTHIHTLCTCCWKTLVHPNRYANHEAISLIHQVF